MVSATAATQTIEARTIAEIAPPLNPLLFLL